MTDASLQDAPISWRQSDEVIRNLIAREIWRYQECEECYGPFDDNADETKQLDIGMRSLIKQTAIDQAELIRAVVLASPVIKATIARLITEDDVYEIGKRDGYEDAIQTLDVATGGDGEFHGSTIPGRTVDVPAMQARIIARTELQTVIDSIPPDLNWLVGKGKTRPDEPLYGAQLLCVIEVVAEGENDDLCVAIRNAMSSFQSTVKA